LVLLAFAAFYFMPFYVMIITGLKPLKDVNATRMWDLPAGLYLGSFTEAWRLVSPNFWNSMIITIPAALISSMIGSVNGYIFANLPGLDMDKGDRVRWHLVGMGNEVDQHTPHWHGKVLKINGTYTDIAELLPGSMKSGDMIADNPGEWMYHCRVADHITAGMTSLYRVHDKK